jgi:hypothetical protein
MSTRGEVAQSVNRACTAAMKLSWLERQLPAPSAIKAVNAAEGEFILAARALTEMVDDLEPGEMPRDWRREREQRAS